MYGNKPSDKLRSGKKIEFAPMTIQQFRKELWRGMTDLILMSIISESIITTGKIIVRLRKEGLDPDFGHIHRRLLKMAQNGILKAEWETKAAYTVDNDKTWQLTEEGWAFLRIADQEWQKLAKQMYHVRSGRNKK